MTGLEGRTIFGVVEVVIDGSAGLGTPDTGTTLEAVFESLRRSAAQRGRVIVNFTLDGEVLNPRRVAEIGGREPGGFGLLEVRTIDPVPVSKETLTGLLNLSASLERGHELAMTFLADGAHAKAVEKLDECVRGWEILSRGVRDIGLLTSADPRVLQADGEAVESHIHNLQGALLRFRNAFESKDVPLMGEVARQDLRPLIQKWRAVIEALNRHAQRALSKPS